MSRLVFNSKNAYVFGGSSGIGLEAAKLLSQRGASVILFARNGQRLREAIEAVAACRLSPAQKFMSVQVDVSDNKAVDEAAAKAVAEFGTPQIVINSAGRALPRRFEDISFEQFDETMKINLYGVWNTVSALVPHMKERGGCIVNTSSVGGFLGVFGYADYAASKFGVIGLSEVLRSELKPYGIRVSVLCPPDTDTPGFENENKTKPDETRAISEGAGLMQPRDVALAMLRGMERGDPMIIPGMEGKMTHLAKRWLPSLVELFMDRSIRNVRKER